MKNRVPSFIRWRYEVRLEKYVDLYGSLGFYIKEKFLRLKYMYLKKPSVIYIYANKRNVGDYISHLGVRQIVGIDGPSSFCSSIYAKKLKKQLRIYRKRNKSCILIIGGGGLFQPAFNEFWSIVLNSQLNFCIIGVGINKMKGREEMSSTLLSEIIKNSSFTIVRDTDSGQRLFGYSQKELTQKISICPSVNYFHKHYYNANPELNKTLVHVIHPSDLRLAEADRELISENLRKIAFHLKLKYVEHTNMSADHKKCLLSINQARIVVSSRLHGCIMSHGMGIPFLPLYCDDKTAAFVSTHSAVSGIEAKLAENYSILLNALEDCMSIFSPNLTLLKSKISDNDKYGAEVAKLVCRES